MNNRFAILLRNFILSSFLILASVASLKAQGKANEKNVQISYLGTHAGLTQFHVKYNNPRGQKFNIVISDKDGYPIYSEAGRSKNLDKKLQLVTADNSTLNVVIKNGKQPVIKQSFEISSDMLQDVMVTISK